MGGAEQGVEAAAALTHAASPGYTSPTSLLGSNVAIVVGGVALLAARCGLPRRWRTPVVLLALVGLVLLCRPEPSVLRAGVMGTVGLLALTSGGQRATLPALGAAGAVLLCEDPWMADRLPAERTGPPLPQRSCWPHRPSASRPGRRSNVLTPV